ncbi:MAG: T9SS C-terminal target domain-containing protein, partial [Saprospiraceae bacterium]|nr:T9SS C-terminal target domain-containing protein [Saprospiraceae bacterium]
MRTCVVIFFLWIHSPFLWSQKTSFSIQLQPFSIDGLGGLQSFAWAQSDGKWLVIGGRRDGLHRRQPFAAFDLPGQNDQIYVVDPVNLRFWSKSLSELPISFRDPLKSTNMQFHQDGDLLYLFGGYGYSEKESRHTTYATVSILDVPAMMNAVIQKEPLLPHVRQWNDSRLQVTGGDIKKMGKHFYLIG